MTDQTPTADTLTIRPESSFMQVRLKSHISLCGDDAEPLVTWSASLVYPAEMISLLERPWETDVILATGSWYTFDFERGNIDEVLDSSAELAMYLTLANDDEGMEEVAQAWVKGLLIANRITVPSQYRGHRYGLLLEAAVLRELSDNRLIATIPAAFEVDAKSPERDLADERLKRLWGTFGFTQYDENVWVLSPSTHDFHVLVGKYKADADGHEITVIR